MRTKFRKLPSALKHGAYSSTTILPGESRAAFKKLHQKLIAELKPDSDAPLENHHVATIARLMWRSQNFDSFRIAKVARARYSAIASEKVPTQAVPYLEDFTGGADPADVKKGMASYESPSPERAWRV